jgi:hypothetical protein
MEGHLVALLITVVVDLRDTTEDLHTMVVHPEVGPMVDLLTHMAGVDHHTTEVGSLFIHMVEREFHHMGHHIIHMALRIMVVRMDLNHLHTPIHHMHIMCSLIIGYLN